ncbi:YkgJ family cysteine cluster protein [Gallibacterium anatis]|uniref:Flagellin N-methylase n=1 Tax=Gallibacterium anatis TaxID=750 RepID=A0A1A7NYX1_9PAST|nr:YkgJ family cysteine cluster protein [Gallibacterium anatis]OBW94898.1 flagellin N-methylase [Gallibacterium anatis]OBW98606.1 flagellin N-methylase [Gallibacterium anatis]UZD16813.1 YkgJ family cysteine cluster protein [Gallibacterium anatis]
MDKLSDFPCSACGKCCRRVNLSEQTRFLDRGDGICLHFDESTNLCKIYENRPLVCRVKDYYLANLTDQYSWEEFVFLNIKICEVLQKE